MSELPTTARWAAPVPTQFPAPPAAHVLVAAADDSARSAREQQLTAAGLRVSVARTGFEAIVKASCHVPDLILLDKSLGETEAAETRRLLTTCPVTAHIPVRGLPAGRKVPRRLLGSLLRAASL
jgi:CheY-like chemotaxis protein